MLVNGPDEVYVERQGRVERMDVRVRRASRSSVTRSSAILAPLGRRVDELSPMADARLRDGSRVNVVIPPLAVDSPVLSIRRFAGERPDAERLVELGHAHARGCASCSGRGRPARRQRSDLRRHGLGQDHAAERAVGVHRSRRAGDHDRGRRRAAAAPAARGPPGEPSGLGRGPWGGHHPRPAPKRAADAPGPDRDRRGPGRGGARPPGRAQHRATTGRSRPSTPTRPRMRCGASRRWR